MTPLLSLCLVHAAHAQWQWMDASGQKVYSDMAPPAGTPEQRILKRPLGSSGQPGSGAPDAKAPSGRVDAGKATTKESDLDAKKKQADAQELAKKKEEEAKQAAVKAENCQRARQSKMAFDSGLRIATTNAKGERTFMDEKTRSAELARVQKMIQDSCS